MRFARVACIFIIGFAALGNGCAKYEYDLAQPAEHARHIGKGVDQSVTIEPITYRMRTVDNRLVIRAYNDTDEPIELLGDKSSVVDPSGQSHPLRGQSVAPHSFVKLILPPPRPQYYDPSPNVGFGIGYGMRVNADTPNSLPDRTAFHTHENAFEPYFRDTPQYATVYDESDAFYWDWKGGGEARLSLVFRKANKDEFTHTFVFRRVKM
jgi:hypothetical protein